MKPDWAHDGIELYCGDCKEVLPQLPAGHADAVVTDPPYGVNVEYNSAFQDDQSYWLSLAKTVLPLCLEAATGPVMWFGASSTLRRDLLAFDPPPERLLIWNPAFAFSKTSKNGIFYRWHPIYCWRLPKNVPEGAPRCDVLRERCDGRNWWNHPGTKPVALMERLCSIANDGDTVADPFMGSGTTGVACIKTGRRFIGIEVEPEYFKIAVARIKEALHLAQDQLPLAEGRLTGS